MKHYAVLDASGIVMGVSSLYGHVEDDNMIEVPSCDELIIGLKWNGEVFVPVTENKIYAHLELSGGDGMDPIGIINDGVNYMHVKVTFRTGESPDSDVIEAVTGLSHRITIRNANGSIHDIVLVSFENGVAEFDYTTDGKPGICQILESDFEAITVVSTEYTIKLVGDSLFKVYRQL